MPGVTTLHLDDVPPRPGAGTGAHWLALRHALNVRAFGINAYRAPEAGIEVIERHSEADESGRGHQELYVVLEGAARFTVGGQDIPARQGTLVFIDDPRLERVAVSEEPGTTVLAIGGEPGVIFEPSAWEARWLAEQPAG